MRLIDFELVRTLRTLMLVEELNHIGVMVKLDDTEHIVGPQLGHMYLTHI